MNMKPDHAEVRKEVSEYYGETLAKTEDLKTNACLTSKAPSKAIREILATVPSEVIAKYYGCGSPLPQGIEGLSVLDLGCGSGRDCYVASKLVGPQGKVTGVDMTLQQLDVAKRNQAAYAETLGYANMTFVQGTIENLGSIPSDSIDIIISNCVVNLSPDKPAVLREAFRVLREGGEFYFSDVYGDRRLPAACCGSGVSRRSSLSSQTAFLAAATLRFEQTQSRVEHPFFGAAVPLKLGVDQVHRAEAVAAGGWACAGANGRAGRLAGEAVAGGRRTLRRGRGTCPRPGRRPTSAPAGRCGGFGRRIRAAGRAAAVVGGRRRSTSSTRVSCQPSFRPPKSCFWRRSSPVVQSSL